MKIGVLGGDKRQVYLAKAIAGDGYKVMLGGLEQVLSDEELPQKAYKELIKSCTHIILPLPVTRDGKTLFAPYTSEIIVLDDDFAKSLKGKEVYGGLMDKLTGTSEIWKKGSCNDYYKREELVLGNAWLTAEAALGLAIHEYDGSLNHAKCLVTGFGRIGKALCTLLRGVGADVDCAARKSKDLTEINCIGCSAVAYQNIDRKYDVIFNTVPVEVLGEKQLLRQDSDTVIIELASLPGGVDLKTAQRLKIRIVSAQSLPGRFSPKSAGEYIKETIYNMMEES